MGPAFQARRHRLRRVRAGRVVEKAAQHSPGFPSQQQQQPISAEWTVVLKAATAAAAAAAAAAVLPLPLPPRLQERCSGATTWRCGT